MNSLYAIFFLVALILFAAIAGVSWWQQKSKAQSLDRRSRRTPTDSFDQDPLLANPSDNVVEDNIGNTLEQKSSAKNQENRISLPEKKPVAPHFDDLSKGEASSDSQSLNGEAEVVALPLKDQRVSPTIENSASKTSGIASKSSAQIPPQFDTNASLVTKLVARVQNPEPIEQHDLLTLFREYDFKFQRKVHIYGLNQMTDEWCDIEYELSSARFVELGVSIQLADPRGSMTEKESHDFQQMALELTNRFNATFEFSRGIDAAAEQAKRLDEIGRRFDSMAVLNVVPKSKTGFRIADIESCARDLMMSTDKNGIFMKTQGDKHDLEVLYRLACTDDSGQFGIVGGGAAANGAAVHDLVIYMNVPATNAPDLVFQEMIKDANSLATWLDGRVVDRNGRAVSQRSYTALMGQISDIVDGMRTEGLQPGDAVSRKLF